MHWNILSFSDISLVSPQTPSTMSSNFNLHTMTAQLSGILHFYRKKPQPHIFNHFLAQSSGKHLYSGTCDGTEGDKK